MPLLYTRRLRVETVVGFRLMIPAPPPCSTMGGLIGICPENPVLARYPSHRIAEVLRTCLSVLPGLRQGL
jgi:hypothetical protein